MCDSTEGSLYPTPRATPMVIHHSMWIQWLFFFKILTNRSMTPRWTLIPLLLRSHVWLYPRIIVSKSHENTSKYMDTVTLFSKTRTKGHWPLDDLWPNICWGDMCDFTQGSLCPSPMGIHQCMWIQWSILQNTTYIYVFILRTEWLIINMIKSLSEQSSGETKIVHIHIFSFIFRNNQKKKKKKKKVCMTNYNTVCQKRHLFDELIFLWLWCNDNRWWWYGPGMWAFKLQEISEVIELWLTGKQ